MNKVGFTILLTLSIYSLAYPLNYGYCNDSTMIWLCRDNKCDSIKGKFGPIISIESNNDYIFYSLLEGENPYRGRLYKVYEKGTNPQEISVCSNQYKPFSFCKNMTITEENNKLYFHKNGYKKNLITISSEWPILSPSGKYLFFISGDEYYIYSFKNKKYWQPVKNTIKRFPDINWLLRDITWINDEETIFIDDEGLKQLNIKKASVNTIFEEEGLFYLCYNPNLKKLLIVKSMYADPPKAIIYCYDRNNNKKEIIVDNGAMNGEIAWASKNEFLYTSNIEGKYNIYIYSFKSKTSTRLTHGTDNYRKPFIIE